MIHLTSKNIGQHPQWVQDLYAYGDHLLDRLLSAIQFNDYTEQRKIKNQIAVVREQLAERGYKA